MLSNQKPETSPSTTPFDRLRASLGTGTEQSRSARNQKKNLTRLLKDKLPKDIFKLICKIGGLAEERGVSAYIVGGFVRDILLGVKNLDLDIVIEAQAIDFVQFLKSKIKIDLLTYPKFGTATIRFTNGFKIDFATSRKEYYPSPGSPPEVTASSIKEDLYRRDFTINTLAVKINRREFGKLLDLFGGQKDLAGKKIRVLHNASFIDDPTRILRAIRFEQRYDFIIEQQTLKLMRRAIRQGRLKRLSRFRLGREFILLLKEKRALKAILRFDKLCGLKLIHPLMRLDKAVLAELKSCKAEDSWLVYFALLARKLNAQQVEKICAEFSLSRKDRKRLKETINGDSGQ